MYPGVRYDGVPQCRDAILRHYGDRKDARILDVCAGTGLVGKLVSSVYFRILNHACFHTQRYINVITGSCILSRDIGALYLKHTLKHISHTLSMSHHHPRTKIAPQSKSSPNECWVTKNYKINYIQPYQPILY